jgi:Rubredoxin-like zinc ribbon domain (DUF35_N)
VPTRPDGRLSTVAWAGDGDPGYLLRPSPDSDRFFAELAAGRFVLRRCPSCSRSRYPHAPVCPYCGTDGYEWRPEPFTGMEVRLAAERWPGGAAVPIFVAAAQRDE